MSGRATASAALVERIRRFVDASLIQPSSAESFDALAMAIHRYQVARDPVLASLVERPVEAWHDIPAVPVAVFKELPIGAVRPGAVVFRTSGTTGAGRGEHHLADTALYDHNAVAWARRCVPGLPTRGLALLDDPARVPDSSLAAMVARLVTDCTWHAPEGVVDGAGARARAAEGHALFVATTAFALESWLSDRPAPLPAGSVLMVTGGFKGRHHALDDAALYAAARQWLAPARLVTEYGMTELSSQLWGLPGLPYLPPPWLRVIAVDPHDGTPRSQGDVGQLRFYDLCNLDGTLAIETLDQGRVLADGSVELHGRLTDAPARGCSLTVEEAWARR